ncbi:MAG TPA: DegT/DnrJ/EryC1/StrS family aminotransferase, partial [Gemmatimonadales bacterium]|nr:DegT/DnrJ/EryC1/StrS family aminotransferase [Gemmatimonadales bacterium]
MKLRYLPPVRSPVTLRAVLAGLVPRRSALERARELIAAECEPDAVLLTDSGTSALRLALEAVTRQRGKDATIALPAWCCYDVATAADGAGVRVVLYDLDPSTLSPDLGSLERVLARGASAVVVAHLYGYPVDLRAVRDLADRAGALLIEDAAQGVGGRYEGRPLGVYAPLAVLSFGRGKGRTGG